MKKIIMLLAVSFCLIVGVMYLVKENGGTERATDRNVPGATTGHGRSSLTE